MSDSVAIKDFSKKRKVVQFTLDGELYVCYPALSIPSLQDVTKISKDFTIDNAIEALGEFFDIIMPEEPAGRLKAKLLNRNDPLEIEQAADIMHWIVEEYGLRPTKSSSASSTGSPTDGDGTRSTAGA